MPDDPAAIVIPFGKHKGATVAELLAKDPSYVNWLMGQGWLAERFAELHTAILTRGAITDDTPEHNRIQARFLDPIFRAAFILLTQDVPKVRNEDWRTRTEFPEAELKQAKKTAADHQSSIDRLGPSNDRFDQAYRQRLLKYKIDADQKVAEAQADLNAIKPLPLLSTVAFEQLGVDVLIQWGFLQTISSYRPRQFTIEIKPSIGDDYPTVMRQMQRLRTPYLLIETYTGATIPLPILKSMFEANKQTLVSLRDVEAEIPNARNLIS